MFLTFDDGGISAYSIIADLLEDRNWIGHFFVTAGWIGTRAFMNVSQLRDLDARGHVIGSHSWSHPLRISALGPPAILAEWQRSTERIADILGKPILTGSVPGGYSSREVLRAAEQAGIRFLFTSEPVIRPRVIGSTLTLGRFSITRSTPAAQALALANGTGWVRRRQWASWNLRKGMKVLGGPLYHRLREMVLRWQLRT
jgi:peptidoglycan/xylan/chitin deacetylase (PgdA/CDA1 family)